MTRPQYVRDISDAYTEMYTPPVNERPLTEKQMNNDDDHVDGIPKWQRLLQKHAQKEDRKRPPHGVHVEPAADAEEEENENIGVGSDFMKSYLDAKETQNREVDDAAQEYLRSVINDPDMENLPAAAGGVSIYSVIKDAFNAGAGRRK